MRTRATGLSLGLVALTVCIFGQAVGFGFTNLDDTFYVTGNPEVLAGLTGHGFQWAFTTFTQLNWHPLTWLSLMLDAQLTRLLLGWTVGPAPAAVFHATNIVLHAANAVLLLLLLARLTGRLWRAAFVAALFAAHPLHVESVAWVTERKDVLSTCFWLLTTLAYVAYTRRRGGDESGRAGAGSRRMLPVLLFFSLGLLAKPMLVTLPFVLLLLDFWPLGRLDLSGGAPSAVALRGLLREKLPLFLVAAGSSAVTLAAERSQGGIVPSEVLPFAARAANAAVSGAWYLLKTAWPSGLSCLYPHPGLSAPAWVVAASAALLAAVTALGLVAIRRHPYVTTGWLWYLVTLVPVSGLVQVGRQARADRYTYVPLIGIFVIVAWLVPALAARRRGFSRAFAATQAAAAATAVLALSGATYRQAGYWHDSLRLNRRAIAVTENNFVAHNNLGHALAGVGDYDGALRHFTTAIRIFPGFMDARYNLGTLYQSLGRLSEAEEQLSIVAREKPDNVRARVNLGWIYARTARPGLAVESFRAVLEKDPANEKALAALRLLGAAP